MRNLFADLPDSIAEELVEILAETENIRIERIVSTGQSSPDGFWYDQDEHEFVVLLKGRAYLQFEDEDQPTKMEPGDCINIASHRKHRVESTSIEEPTVWLAVFYSKEQGC